MLPWLMPRFNDKKLDIANYYAGRGKLDDVDVTWGGYTSLRRASKMGHLKYMKALLVVGTDKNKVDNYDCSPLFNTIIHDREEITRVLISAGADVNLAEQNGRSPLIAATERDQVEILRLLLTAGADKTTSIKYIR